ncbi:MAG: hypothetical protein WA110_09820 [Anaerolineaceae bacterium]
MENKPTQSKLRPLAIVAVVLVAAAVLGLVYLMLRLANPAPNAPGENPTAALTIIPAPTHTEQAILPTSGSQVTPTSAVVLPQGTIGVGAYVKVGRTDGVGLRMRADAGTSAEVQFIAMDDEVFLVIGGPVEMDGYTWWQLKAPYDQNRTGWSAESFLDLVDLTTPTP